MAEFTIEQFKEWVNETFPNNTLRAIGESNFRDGLIALAEFVFKTNSSEYILDSIAQVNTLKGSAEKAVTDVEAIRIAIGVIQGLVSGDRSATQTFRNQAQILLENALLAENPLGDYNPVSNTPAISAIPPASPGTPKGSWYSVTEPGILPFGGSNFNAGISIAVGGKIVKKSETQWYYQKPVDTGLQQLQDLKSSISRIIAFENLFNKATQKLNTAITNITPGTGGAEVTTAGWVLSDKIPFPENTAGVLTNFSGGYNGRVHAYTAADVYLGDVTRSTQPGYYTFTTPATTAYLKVAIANSVATQVQADTFMLLKGNVYPSSYVPYNSPVLIGVDKILNAPIIAGLLSTELGNRTILAYLTDKGYLTPSSSVFNNYLNKSSDFSFTERGQLYNPDTSLQNQSIISATTGDPSDGTIVNQTGQWWSGYIPVDPSKGNLARSVVTGRFFFYDSAKVFISKTNSGVTTAAIPSNAAYVAFIVAATSGTWPNAYTIMLNYGTTVLPYAAYGSDIMIKKAAAHELLAAKISTELGEKTILEYLVAKGLIITKSAPTLLKPAKVYSICNDTRPLNQEYSYGTDLTSSIYIDHMFNLGTGPELNAYVKENSTDRFNFSGAKSVDGSGVPIYNNGLDISTIPKTFTVTGDIVDQVIALNQISVKASYLKSKPILHLKLSDSTGYGTSTALIDVPDGSPSKVCDFMLVYMERLRVDAGNPVNDYIYKPLGTRYKRQIDFNYRGVSKTLQSYTESLGGWAAVDLYLYTDRLSTNMGQGVWDRLGLGNGSGTDYTATVGQKTTILTTPEGKFAPVNTAAFITHMNSFYGGITTYALAVSKQNALLADPPNPFFDSSLTGNFRFSLGKYIERYQTINPLTFARLIPGSTAGTKVNDSNAHDVCAPTHITLGLGTNDQATNPAEYVAAMLGMANQIKAYDPNIIVFLSMIDCVGTYFPKRYPNYSGVSLYDNSSSHSKAFLFNQQLMALENVSSKLFYLPSYFVQPTAEAVPVKKTPRAKSLAGLSPETDMMYNEWGKQTSIHPNAAAYAEIGVHELSALLYSKQFMV